MHTVLRGESLKHLLTVAVIAVVLGWVASTLIVLAYGKLVPQSYTSSELQSFQEKLKTRGYLTQQELEEMDRKAELLHQDVQRGIKQENLAYRFDELRSRALIVSWLPWLIIGVVGLKERRMAWLVSIVLFVLSMIHVVLVAEAFAFCIATLFGFYGRLFMGPKGPGSI